MNVSCPECRSVFRVDPAKVPPSGVRARCSVCGGVITIGATAGSDEFGLATIGSPSGAGGTAGAARPGPARTDCSQ